MWRHEILTHGNGMLIYQTICIGHFHTHLLYFYFLSSINIYQINRIEIIHRQGFVSDLYHGVLRKYFPQTIL